MLLEALFSLNDLQIILLFMIVSFNKFSIESY